MEGYILASFWVDLEEKAYLSHIQGLIHPTPANFLLHHHPSFLRSSYRFSFVTDDIAQVGDVERRGNGKKDETYTGQSSPTASFLFPFDVSSAFDSFDSCASSDIAPVAFK
jgi:hypothetical protein